MTINTSDDDNSVGEVDEKTLLVPNNKIEDRGNNSTLWSFVLIIKSYVGSGVMGLPFAFLQGGIWPGIATIILVAVVSAYCIDLLLKIKRHIQDNHPHITTFGEIGEYCLGKTGYYLVQGSLLFTQVGFSTAYVIFIGQNMHHEFPVLSHFEWTCVVFPLFVGICLIRRWKWLAPFSFVGYIAIMFGLSVVMQYCFRVELIPGKTSITWEKINRIEVRTLPIFFGIVVYIFEGIGLVIDMEKAMKKPDQFQNCLHLSYLILLITFIFTGCIGYLTFFDDTKNIIILNLPKGALTSVVIWLIMFALYTSYPVQMFPVFAIIENILFDQKTNYLEMKRNALRTGLVLGSFLIAVGIPHFGLFMSLIGSLGGSLLAFILPTIFYIKLFWGKTHPVRLVFNIIVCVFGIVASAISTTTTVIDIIKTF